MVTPDRKMIIPDLPKIEYRNGYGAYEGGEMIIVQRHHKRQ